MRLSEHLFTSIQIGEQVRQSDCPGQDPQGGPLLSALLRNAQVSRPRWQGKKYNFHIT